MTLAALLCLLLSSLALRLVVPGVGETCNQIGAVALGTHPCSHPSLGFPSIPVTIVGRWYGWVVWPWLVGGGGLYATVG